MPRRLTPFVDGEFYHIFNRGISNMATFINPSDYNRFLKTAFYYQIEGPKPRFSLYTPVINLRNSNQKIVEIVCYCLMPNHFHFLLRQNRNNGITELISKLSNSYTKYFNIKNRRLGPLLQGEFKSVHIETNDQLIHLSRYIHLNPLVSYKTENLNSYQWSSCPEYLGANKNNLCFKKIIVEQFKTLKDYEKFVLDQENYGKELERIKHLIIDNPQV